MNLKNGEAIEYIAHIRGQELEFHPPDSSAEAIYSYEDENRGLVMQKLRYPGKEFKQRQPAPGGGWIWNLDGVKPLLYDLPAVRDALTVCITEGEKDADRVTRLGLLDTTGNRVVGTTSGSADSWVDELAETLQGKRVVILPDSDEPGQDYANQIGTSLERRGIEYRVRGFGHDVAKDVSEFLDMGHSVEELVEIIGADWVQLPMPEPNRVEALEIVPAQIIVQEENGGQMPAYLDH